jgi:large subunit ribosomal protein L25
MKPGVLLQLEPRTPDQGLGELRRHGMVPGVIVAPGQPSVPVAVSLRDLNAAISQGAEHHPCRVQQGANPVQMAILKEVQRHRLSGQVIHVDFLPVDQDKPVHVTVPVKLNGEAELTAGGLLLHVQLHELKVEAKPADIPDFIAVDVAHVKAGDSFTVAQLKVPAGITVLEPASHVIFTAAHTRVHLEAEEQIAPAVIVPGAAGITGPFTAVAKPDEKKN